MFYENLQKICKEQKTTPTALIKTLGFSSSKVTAWKNGSIPKYEILKKLSVALNVPVYLFFVEQDLLEHASANLSKHEQLLLNGFRSLSDQGQEYILQTMDLAVSRYKKDNSVSKLENIG